MPPRMIRHVSARIDSEGQNRQSQLVAGARKDHKVHNQQLYHHGRAPDHRGIHLTGAVEKPNHHAAPARPLLIVGGADDRHQNAQNYADHQRRSGDLQRDAQALQIHLPAVSLQKALVEVVQQLGGEGNRLLGGAESIIARQSVLPESHCLISFIFGRKRGGKCRPSFA